MATHSSILARRIPMDRGAQWAAVHGVTESDTTERPSTAQHIQSKAFIDHHHSLKDAASHLSLIHSLLYPILLSLIHLLQKYLVSTL